MYYYGNEPGKPCLNTAVSRSLLLGLRGFPQGTQFSPLIKSQYFHLHVIAFTILILPQRDRYFIVMGLSLHQVGRMGSFMMGVDQDKKEEGKLAKTTRDRFNINYFYSIIFCF